MNGDKSQRAMKISAMVYKRLVRAYPKGFREKYGTEMVQIFREQCRDAESSAGRFELTKLWLRTLFDLAKSCPSEHVAAFGGNMIMFKQTLLARLWLAPLLAFLAAGGASAFVSARLLPKVYMSAARIYVEHPTQTANDSANFDPYWLQTQFELISSPPVLDHVIDRLALSQRWAVRHGAKEALSREETLHLLRNSLELRQTRSTSLIEIRVANEDRKEAAEIANAIAAVYQRQVAERATTKVQVIDSAEPSLRPVRPNVPATTVGFGLGAAIVALVFVLFARLFKKRARASAQLEAAGA